MALFVFCVGLGAALDLAVRKGYLEREKGKTKQKGSKTRIEADNYSIEDKRYEYVTSLQHFVFYAIVFQRQND